MPVPQYTIQINDRDIQQSCPRSMADLIDLHCGVSSDALIATLSRALRVHDTGMHA